MTFYASKLNELKKSLYKNQEQINAIIATKNYINKHYPSEVSLQLLSEAHYISKYHLIRLFKKYYGITPRQYLIDTRIEKSKENLTKGMTVSETCYAVGFESIGSFSALFKTKVGKTPIQYQKEQFSRNISNNEI